MTMHRHLQKVLRRPVGKKHLVLTQDFPKSFTHGFPLGFRKKWDEVGQDRIGCDGMGRDGIKTAPTNISGNYCSEE